MVTPSRGDVWWVRRGTADEQASDATERRRPYLVVSGDPWNHEPRYPRITVCPLTGLENVTRRYDTDVVLRKRETGLPKDSVVKCVEVYTFFRERLIERVAQLSPARMREIDHALGLYLSLVLP